MKSKALSVLALCAVFGLSGCYSLNTDVIERDDSGQVTAPAEFDAVSISVGDCANNPELIGEPGEGETGVFTEITVLPCSDPHELEAYARMDLPHDEFPGDTEVEILADEFCYEEYAGFVGTEYEESSLYFQFFTPTKAGWSFDGDREILCLIAGEEGELLTGSMKGTGR